MTDRQQDQATAERLAKIWRGGADRAAGHGVGDAEIGKSLVAIGIERWLEAEPPEMVAVALLALAEQVCPTRPPAGQKLS